MAEVSEVLPVEWLELTAAASDSGVEISWQTASETDNDFFVVERRSTTTAFADIARVEGGGTAASVSTYHIVDRHSFSGRNYYRIRQVDYDGKWRHSAIISAEFKPHREKYRLYPNPASDVFKAYPPTDDASVSIFSIDGTLIRVFSEDASFSVAGLMPAVYIVRIETAWAAFSIRLVVR